MPNYRPRTKAILATVVDSGIMVVQNISTSAWALALLKGTALSPTGASLASGAVAVWQSTNPTSTSADHTTFTDGQGRYGVTVKANVALKIKFYGK
ncbi:hypothetical protein [Clostridium psychrophilum]|uniref:hypothetical protein n=1 Tax=Clostridium psychrophilum TaxID=132926 RepID=UPI001C0E00FF|nr:hypothetical protein [Clostridium psychrophilum]MBU3181563.1 hypothetical protein [Clostridium psychrophilum]